LRPIAYALPSPNVALVARRARGLPYTRALAFNDSPSFEPPPVEHQLRTGECGGAVSALPFGERIEFARHQRKFGVVAFSDL
jgi:hypothetical protein